MKGTQLLVKKSYLFSLLIIELYKILHFKHREYVMSEHILVKGTSIGSCLEVGQDATSSEEQYMQLTIAYEYARETHYHIRLIRDSHLVDEEVSVVMLVECEELMMMIRKLLQKMERSMPSCQWN
ncbi:MAG: four helix bundle protein [Bacteroidales bacterium]|nr:four helix bundle protein [Lentimicrobiaceae bacterium]MDD5695976.1 four helix bundle protein [Bacteroidales bacterium]